MSLIIQQLDNQTEQFVEKVISLNADTNLRDLRNNTALHHLAMFYERNQAEIESLTNEEKQQVLERIARIGKLIMETNCDLSVENDEKQTAFSIAIRSD